MITLIAATLIGMAIAIYNNFSWTYDDLFDLFALSFLGGSMGGIIGLCMAIIIPMDTYDKHYSLNIEAIQDNNSVSGSFFLGCGTIEDKMKYVFYYKENGMYRMMQVDYDLVQIKYSDSTPKVNVTENAPTESIINLFAIDFDVYDKTYIIDVPKGSIRNNYNLDAN